MVGAGDRDVQPPPSALPVQRPEVHGDLSVLVGPVAHREDQDVAFVALHGLQALNEEAAQPAGSVEEPVQVRPVPPDVTERGFDGDRLPLAERHDAQAPVRPRVEVMDDALCHLRGLCRVVACRASPVCAIHVEQLDADVWAVGVGTGERDQAALVERHVGERDQRFVPGTVVPAQGQAAEDAGALCQVEHRLEIGCVIGFLGPLVPVVGA